jgi:hypothetical protein
MSEPIKIENIFLTRGLQCCKSFLEKYHVTKLWYFSWQKYSLIYIMRHSFGVSNGANLSLKDILLHRFNAQMWRIPLGHNT